MFDADKRIDQLADQHVANVRPRLRRAVESTGGGPEKRVRSSFACADLELPEPARPIAIAPRAAAVDLRGELPTSPDRPVAVARRGAAVGLRRRVSKRLRALNEQKTQDAEQAAKARSTGPWYLAPAGAFPGMKIVPGRGDDSDHCVLARVWPALSKPADLKKLKHKLPLHKAVERYERRWRDIYQRLFPYAPDKPVVQAAPSFSKRGGRARAQRGTETRVGDYSASPRLLASILCWAVSSDRQKGRERIRLYDHRVAAARCLASFINSYCHTLDTPFTILLVQAGCRHVVPVSKGGVMDLRPLCSCTERAWVDFAEIWRTEQYNHQQQEMDWLTRSLECPSMGEFVAAVLLFCPWPRAGSVTQLGHMALAQFGNLLEVTVRLIGHTNPLVLPRIARARRESSTVRELLELAKSQFGKVKDSLPQILRRYIGDDFATHISSFANSIYKESRLVFKFFVLVLLVLRASSAAAAATAMTGLDPWPGPFRCGCCLRLQPRLGRGRRPRPRQRRRHVFFCEISFWKL